MAKINSEKIVLYELWRNILIVLKTHWVIWNSLPPLPPTPASPMESHWMTVVIQLDVDCWSFNALPRTDYEVVKHILIFFFINIELTISTKNEPNVLLFITPTQSIGNKIRLDWLLLISLFPVIIWSWKDKYLNRLSRFWQNHTRFRVTVVNYRPKRLKDHTLLGGKASKEESTPPPPPPPPPPISQPHFRLFHRITLEYSWPLSFQLDLDCLSLNTPPRTEYKIVLLIIILFCLKIEPSIRWKKNEPNVFRFIIPTQSKRK